MQLILFSFLCSGVMALNLLLILNLHWKQRKRSQYIRVNVHLVLHALLAQNCFGGHVLANTLGQREWLVAVFLLAIDKDSCLLHLLNRSMAIFPMKFSSFLSCIRWSAHIEQSFLVKICAEIFYHAATIIVLKPAMPWRTCMQHPSREKEVSLVKSVIFLVKRCLYFYFLHSIIPFSLSFLELYALTKWPFTLVCLSEEEEEIFLQPPHWFLKLTSCLLILNVFIQERRPTCSHPCPLPCHPGECPSCKVLVKRSCHCGTMVHVFECIYYNGLSEKEQITVRSCGGPCHR